MKQVLMNHPRKQSRKVTKEDIAIIEDRQKGCQTAINKIRDDSENLKDNVVDIHRTLSEHDRRIARLEQVS